MYGTDLAAYFLLLLEAGLILAAVVFLLSGLDDLFIDLVHGVRSLYRRWFVLPRYTRLREEHLLLPDEQPLAVMIPAWDEGGVIGRTLEHTATSVHYAHYHIFVGAYPNDAATRRAVEAMAERYDHVHLVVGPRPGPTTKADCLNHIFRGIRRFEKEAGLTFEIFVLHDAEDLIHPLSFKLFNYLVPRKDMVQLPVFPLEAPWYRLTAGHYMDEFAESHSKDMVVRERLSRTVPSAGVGCAFSRRALELMARDRDDEVFSVTSITEDYDFAFRLREYNLEEVFVRQAIERTRERRNPRTGKTRPVVVMEPIATRAFFPWTFRAAVRQKTRWVLGITLQGWAQLGWRGSAWTKYMLFRDRKALLTNHVNVLGYLVLVGLLAVWVAPRIFPEAYRYPPLVARGSWLWTVIVIDTAFLAWRVLARAFYVRAVYGWRQAVLSVPRQLWANVINFAASARAVWLWIGHLLGRRAVAWEKTSHEFPAEEHLQAFRRRLGDLLVARRHITSEELFAALERQRLVLRPLGAVLLEMGLVEPGDLLHVLGTQLHLETREIDPYETPLELLALVPREVATRWSVYPVDLRPDGRVVLATDRALARGEVEEIADRLGRSIKLSLTTHGDLTFAIRRGYERLAPDADGKGAPLGQRLVGQERIGPEQLAQALAVQRRSYLRLGDVLVEEGLLSPEALSQAISGYDAARDDRLGAYLVQHRLITFEQLMHALTVQRHRFRRLGEVMVDLEMVSQGDIDRTLAEAR